MKATKQNETLVLNTTINEVCQYIHKRKKTRGWLLHLVSEGFIKTSANVGTIDENETIKLNLIYTRADKKKQTLWFCREMPELANIENYGVYLQLGFLAAEKMFDKEGGGN